MAFVYATGGSELLIDAWVVDIARRVVTPSDTLAGTWIKMIYLTLKLQKDIKDFLFYYIGWTFFSIK